MTERPSKIMGVGGHPVKRRLTKDAAVERMRVACSSTAVAGRVDHETAHIAADNVLVEIARAAGFGEAADLWEKSAEKWWWA